MTYHEPIARRLAPTCEVLGAVIPVHEPAIGVGLYRSRRGHESVSLKIGDLSVFLTADNAYEISNALVDAAEAINTPPEPEQGDKNHE